MPIYWTQRAVFTRPLVPDGASIFLQPFDIGVTTQEPQQLDDDRAHVDLLGGDQWEAL